MLKEGPYGDPHIAELVVQSRKILDNPEYVFDLAGKRLALRCVELEPYFASHTFRLGIIGNSNRGKTTYAYSSYLALQNYRFPSRYADLDIYSYTGRAIRGQIGWENWPKRTDAPKKEVLESVREFRNAGPGIVIGDFPGKPDKPYQPYRIKAVDMTVLLGNDSLDRSKWERLVTISRKPSLWLRSQPDSIRRYPLDPTLYDLQRIPKPGGLDVMTSLTRIMEVIARIVNVPLRNPWKIFTEPERVVLEEVLDFEFAPYAANVEYT